jgi:hypothetical protein
MTQISDLRHHERLTSNRTLRLFAALTVIFSILLAWRWTARGLDGWTITSLIFTLVFLFYTINYRVLLIDLTPQSLKLKFGLFNWTVPLENIAAIRLDNLPALKRYGGAGIHFMFVDGRYRASFNFLEYPRIVVAFKHKVGPVIDLSFSTRQPERLIELIRTAISPKELSR